MPIVKPINLGTVTRGGPSELVKTARSMDVSNVTVTEEMRQQAQEAKVRLTARRKERADKERAHLSIFIPSTKPT